MSTAASLVLVVLLGLVALNLHLLHRRVSRLEQQTPARLFDTAISLPAPDQHPPSCLCGGTGIAADTDGPCPVQWRLPAGQIRLIGRVPRGSNR